MNALTIFDFQDKEIRTITDNVGNPWFAGMDVAETLGYADTDDAIRRHCKLPKLFKPGETPGLECGPRGMKFIPEPDIYRLIVHSKLPAAAQFEAWIFTEVLPAIRKTGGYITADVNDTNEEILARALMVAQETLERRDEKIRRLKIQNATMRPKALFADAVASSETSILVGEMAKILKQNGVEKMGQNRLFVWLRENGYLIRRKGTDYNMPTQKSMDLKLFEIKERTVGKIGAPARIIKTPKITGKGQQYLTRLFLSDKAA